MAYAAERFHSFPALPDVLCACRALRPKSDDRFLGLLRRLAYCHTRDHADPSFGDSATSTQGLALRSGQSASQFPPKQCSNDYRRGRRGRRCVAAAPAMTDTIDGMPWGICIDGPAEVGEWPLRRKHSFVVHHEDCISETQAPCGYDDLHRRFVYRLLENARERSRRMKLPSLGARVLWLAAGQLPLAAVLNGYSGLPQVGLAVAAVPSDRQDVVHRVEGPANDRPLNF